MKTVTNKLIAIVLAMTLVLSMSGVAFADIDNAVATDRMSGANKGVTLKANPKGKAAVMSEDNTVKGNIKTLEYSTTKIPGYTAVDLPVDEYKLIQFTPTATGYMWLDYKVAGVDATDAVTFKLVDDLQYENGELVNWEYYSLDVVKPGKTKANAAALYVTANTTYNVLVIAGEYEVGEIEDVLYSNDALTTAYVRAKVYKNAQNREIPTDKYILSSGLNKAANGASDIYYKVVPNKTGIMTVDLQYNKGAATGKITLYNAKKKALSNAVNYNSSKLSTKAYFGVVEGNKYYVRVQNACDETGKYGIKHSMTVAKDRDISTNAKAPQLKKGAVATKTMFTANNITGTDTYKIYVPKTQTAKFTVNTQKIRSGNITIKVYKNGKQIGKTKTLYPNNTSGIYTIKYGTKAGKASRGTYYIKVTKGAKASGLYTIKYNK